MKRSTVPSLSDAVQFFFGCFNDVADFVQHSIWNVVVRPVCVCVFWCRIVMSVCSPWLSAMSWSGQRTMFDSI